MADMMVHAHSHSAAEVSGQEDLDVRLHTADPDSSPSSGGAATIEREQQEQQAQPGDHERFSHYVKKDRIMASALEGDAVVALCGKVWVPSRDPQRFPVCPECKEIYEEMQGGDDDSDSGKSGGGFFGFGRNK
ncbi:hypothetical protein GCM10027060_25850 [Nesterenkonia halophila]